MFTCCIVEGKENEVMMEARLSMAMEFSCFCIYPHLGKRSRGVWRLDIVCVKLKQSIKLHPEKPCPCC